jgi:hypothetical protein
MFKGKVFERWNGVYRYNPSISGSRDLRVIDFVMNLKTGWFGSVNGRIDEGAMGIPERAVLRGRLYGGVIRFEKRYQNFWATTPDNKSVVISGLGPHIVHYEGELSEDSRKIVGWWKIPAAPSRIFGNFQYDFPESSGTWEAVCDMAC